MRNMRSINLPFKNQEVLESLYYKSKLSLPKIAKKFGVTHQNILYWMNKYKIPRRIAADELSKVKTKYFKQPFSGNPIEKAYMLGLRTGDLSARTTFRLVRAYTSSTHIAQIEMIKEIFGNYTKVCAYVYSRRGKKLFQVYCNLDKSFNFLLEKPSEIPKEVLENNNLFYSFLAGYADAEGCWDILKNGKNGVTFRFRIATCDKDILRQIRNKLNENRFKTYFLLERKKGFKSNYGKYNHDFYQIGLRCRSDVIYLASQILPLSHHYEKICKMKLILENKDKNWDEIKNKILELRKRIRAKIIK